MAAVRDRDEENSDERPVMNNDQFPARQPSVTSDAAVAATAVAVAAVAAVVAAAATAKAVHESATPFGSRRYPRAIIEPRRTGLIRC